MGLSIMVMAALIGHELLGEWGEKLMTLAGAMIIAASHMSNFQLCRQLDCRDEHG